jgi:hypothetical protein
MALIRCGECGAQVSTRAKACPSCGAKAKKKMSATGRVVLGVFLVVIALPIIASRFGGSSSTPPTNAASDSGGTPFATPAEVASMQAADDGPRWSYDEGADQMRGTRWKTATVDALGKLDFAFPYNGGSTASIELRQMGKRQDVLLMVSKGQFMCHVDGCSIAVKFDDGPVTQYSAAESDDGSNDHIFIEGTAGFTAKLKKATSVTIEAEFFQEGNRQMTFPVQGLRWPLK